MLTDGGRENPAVNSESQKIQEEQDYMALSDYKREFPALLASKVTWAQLSDAENGRLSEASTAATEYQRSNATEANAALLAIVSEAAKVSEINTETFREATAPVYDAWREKYCDFVEALFTQSQA
ncbi:hypothetical protein [Sagittula sp. NFXS13]|uniref:hypothetical protein n=1 Tax=Sagittula sp. NFXS13 TaxID=2819095 RepID=UPI0032DE8E43